MYSIEMKHACYSATFAVQTAKHTLNDKKLVLHPILVTYGLNNSATNYAGAIAFISKTKAC